MEAYWISLQGIRNLMSIPDFRNYGSSLGFKHNFSQTGRELTADINYNFSRSSNNSTYNGQFFDAINNPLGPVLYERSYGEGRTHFLTIQTDYSTPLPPQSENRGRVTHCQKKIQEL